MKEPPLKFEFGTCGKPEATETVVPAAVATALPLKVKVLPEIAVMVVPTGKSVPLEIGIPTEKPVTEATTRLRVPLVTVPVVVNTLIFKFCVSLEAAKAVPS